MTATLTTTEKIRRLPWNTTLGATNNIFAQLTFFGPAFVLILSQLHLSNTQIGFLLSLIPFTGLIALAVAPAAARFGYKRTYVTFFGIRKIFAAGLLLAPLVMARFGVNGILVYITVVIGGFALCRSISETAYFPWAQEFIPNTIRGRYTSINDIMSRFTGIGSLALGSLILGLATGLDGFMIIFLIGLIFGVIAVWAATHIPGGAPMAESAGGSMSYHHMLNVLKDKNFLTYVTALAILIIAVTPMGSFLPLYMTQQIGLTDSMVVTQQIALLIGGLSSTYLFGWAADRYGSKPVMLVGLYVKIALPLMWMLMPRHSALSATAALVIAFINGASDIAWAIGSGRLLYVKVVPSEKRGEYMAVYYAAVGLIGGISQVAGGGALDLTRNLSGQFLFFTIDPFFPLFVFGLIFTAISVYLFTKVQADSNVSVSDFAALFTHGNPVLGLESLVRYYRARDEKETVAMTERMAKTKSPLTVDELLEALIDPRFNVRFEAIISISHMDSDPRLVKALCEFVVGTELSLSVVAAWALGRIGDKDAIPALRHGLASQYRSIQAHSARALGTLLDDESAPVLLERLKTESDRGLRIAYSSALGNLRVSEAIPTLFEILAQTEMKAHVWSWRWLWPV
ncbi:MAG: MFS transporter [Chloroflexota bacterium]